VDPVPLLAQTQTLRVTGMTCASCVATIEKALSATPGVTGVKVNLATETALVHGANLDRPALVAAVEKSGYGVASGSVRQIEAKISQADQQAALRLVICAALTIPLVIIAMGPHVLMLFGSDAGMDMGAAPPDGEGPAGGGMEGMDMPGMDMGGMQMAGADGMAAMPGMEAGMMLENAWPQLLLATPVVIYGGAPIFRGAWNALRGRHITMDTLVSLGIITAFSYSAAITFRPELAPGPGLYFETAAVIVTLILLGRTIEHRARKRAVAMMESATDVGADRAAQVRHILEDAQGSRVGIQAAVDRVIRLFVPLVLTVAIASFLFWWTLGAPIAAAAGLAPQTLALLSLVAVLIIACPCGLGLAIPMAVMAGTARGAQQGILIRSGEALEASRRLDTVVFEKTGILTMGHPEVTDIIPLSGTEQDVLALAGAAEAKSPHPLAIAIHRRAQTSGTTMPGVTETATVDGQGVEATTTEGKIQVGRPQWLAGQGVPMEVVSGQLARLRGEAKTVVGVAHASRLVGLIALTDQAKPSSQAAVKELQDKGFEVVLMAGDDEATTNAVASSLGIKRVLAEVLPADRPTAIRRLRQEEGRCVAVVGDGRKDAAILAEANVGIAMGPGDLTQHAGNILLLKDDPAGAAAGIDLARSTLRKARQNLVWAFAYNVALIPVAAGLLVAWPIFGQRLQLDPMYGAVAMTLSIVSVIANSMRLQRWRRRTMAKSVARPGEAQAV
jgi:P-type Cu+ transporter